MESNVDLSKELDDIHKLESVLSGHAVAKTNRAGDTDAVLTLDVDIASRSVSPDCCSEASSYQAHLTPAAQNNTYSVFGELTAISDEEQSQDVLEDASITLDDLEPTLENVLLINQAYQSVLIDMVQKLDVIQISNRKRQETLQREIDQLNEEIACSKKNKDKGSKLKKITFEFFGMPYFKDENFNCPPKNQDDELGKTLKYRSIAALAAYKPIRKHEVKKLYSVLKERAKNFRLTNLTSERNEVEKRIQQIREEMKLDHRSELLKDDLDVLEKKYEFLNREIFMVDFCPDSKLFDVDADVFDWENISVEMFNRTYKHQQLRLHWSHYMSPRVNCGIWSMEENRKLKALVEKYKDKGIDWKEVASGLSTNRTPYACFRRFQDRYNRRIRKFGWSEEDNAKFVSLVTKYSDGVTVNYVDWEDVRRHFPGRTKTQLYSHLKYHTHVIDKSPFCQPEDVAILEGVKMGYSFNDIALLLGNRTLRQIRNRYKVIERYEVDQPWTEEEDHILLNLKDTTMLKKRTIDKQLGGRSFAQLFSRFHYLRMKQTTPAQYVEQMKSAARNKRKVTIRNVHISKIMYDLMKKFGSTNVEQHKRSMKSRGFPMYKRQFTKIFSEPVKKEKPYWNKNYRVKHGPKKNIAQKEAELKEILRPLINAHAKRLRKMSFPGDGREYGLVLASLHRLLNCNFTLAPPTAEISEEDIEGMGVASGNALPVLELLKLVEEIVPSVDGATTKSISCLPPTLSTLTGYRGIDLHLKYLEVSANRDYFPPGQQQNPLEKGTTVELEHNIFTTNRRPLSQNGEPLVMDVETFSYDTQGSGSVGFDDGDERPSPVADHTTDLLEKDEAEQASVLHVSSATLTETVDESLQSTEVEKDSVPKPSASENDEYLRLRTPEHNIDEDGSSMAYDEHRPLSSGDDTRPLFIEVDDNRTLFDQVEEEIYEGDNGKLVAAFGNPESDSLLLSRLLTLFYWPGIMSTMPVPPEIKEATIASNKTATPEPEIENASPSPRKKFAKTQRKLFMQALAKKRFRPKDADGNPVEDEPVASTSLVVEPKMPQQTPSKRRGRPPKKKLDETLAGDSLTSESPVIPARSPVNTRSSVITTPDIIDRDLQAVSTSTANTSVTEEIPSNYPKRTYKKRKSQPVEGGRVITRRSTANQQKE